VQSGDTLLRIANRFGVTTQQVMSFNSISNPNLIRVGQRLLIPTSTDAVAPTPTPTPTPTTGSQPSTQSVEYIVQSGDTLLRIANRFGVTTQQVMSFNSISNPNLIRVGQRLLIPTSTDAVAPTTQPAPAPTASPSPTEATTSYTVVSGDTLFSIARRFRVTVSALAELNSITNANLIRVGQRLQVPAR
jgi:LysM repeat protein